MDKKGIEKIIELHNKMIETDRTALKCLWYHTLIKGVAFVGRTPDDLACYDCFKNRTYLSCKMYHELGVKR